MESSGEFIKFLGKGAYGSVDLVKYTNGNGSSFNAAVKTSDDYDSLQRELDILSELRGYPSIVRCYGDYLEQGFNPRGYKVYKLLLEHASHGSLNTFMDKYKDRKLPDKMIRDFTSMILEGLVCIHSHGYVHCDLKSDNLLVFPRGDSFELKISDFGNSLEVGEVPPYWEIDFPFVGTPIYMPPESLADGVAETAIDLWSLGCLVCEMYSGVGPWPGVEIDDLATLLFDGNAPAIPENLPCDAREFIETCFARKPEDRGSAYELLSHRFLLQEEEEKTEKIVTEQRRNSLLMKLKLRIIKASKKPMVVVAEKPLKLKIFAMKAPQFKKILSKFSSLMKHSDSSLVYVK